MTDEPGVPNGETAPPNRSGTLNVLVFAASQRTASLNRALALLAADVARKTGANVDLAIMREFDAISYDGDAEAAGEIPPGAQEFRRRLEAADAFIIAAPEYNGSMSGALKNLIDWTSRILPQPFDGRHALLLSASPSLAGGNRGLWALRMPLEHLGARVFPDMFSLAAADKALVAGKIADKGLRKRFDTTIRAFLSLAEAAKNYPCMKRAWVEFLGEPSFQTDELEEPVPV